MLRLRRGGAVVSATLLLVLAEVLLIQNAAAQAPPGQYFNRAGTPIGLGVFRLTNEHLDGQRIRAFVLTGSNSDRCLLTLNETTYRVPGITLLCRPNEDPNTLGLTIIIFLPGDPGPNLEMFVNAYQEFAKFGEFPVVVPCVTISGCGYEN